MRKGLFLENNCASKLGLVKHQVELSHHFVVEGLRGFGVGVSDVSQFFAQLLKRRLGPDYFPRHLRR